MIEQLKKDKIVLLTTHNLEEADYLSDRVMILAAGQVVAYGDSMALKQTYGNGYQIRMTIDRRIANSLTAEISKVSQFTHYHPCERYLPTDVMIDFDSFPSRSHK